jgi:hypothetical protein
MARIDNLDADQLAAILRRLDALERQAPVGFTTVTRGALRVLSEAGFYVGGAASAIIDGLLRVTGILNVIGTLNVSGNNNITGPTSQDGPLTVNGSSTFTGPETHAGQLDYTGNETHAGDLQYQGNEMHRGNEAHFGILGYTGDETHNGNEAHNGTSTVNGSVVINGPVPLTMTNGAIVSGGAQIAFVSGIGMVISYLSSKIEVGPFGVSLNGGGGASISVSSLGIVTINGRVYMPDLPAKPA